MSRITLKSSNTAVILADSPAFKTVDESGSLFAGVTSASFGFSTNRQALSQLGYKDLAVNDIIRSPDVDLSLTYNYTPTYANEDLMGLNFSLDEKSEFSLMSTLKDKSYNFYFYNNPEQGEDGTQSVKDQYFLPGGEIISFGNAYLNKYSMDFQIGSYPTVSVGFQCSNVESEKYYGTNTKSPAINLESGNAIGVGDFDITKTQIYEEGFFGEILDLDRSKLPSVTPSELQFTLQDLEIGGQKLSPNNHILSSFKFEMDVERASYYKLGSNYACGRDIKYPVNAKVSISSLVNSYENGFISGLVVGEELNFLDIVATDCSGIITSKLFFENLKIERVRYDMLVNQSMNYSLDLSLKINDEEGFKTYITEEEWKATRVYDSAGNIDDSRFGNIEPEWKINDDNIYAIRFADFFNYEIGDRAFYDCNNVSGKLFFPRNVNYIGESSFENCTEVSQIFFDTDHIITSIGSSGFKGCSGISMSNLLLPGSLDIIGSSCFEDCINIQGVNLNKVSSIGDRSFYNCNSLNGPLALREGVNYLGESAFENCTSLNGSIEFPDSLDYISRYLFKNCGSLQYDLVINDSITGIGEQAFYDCSGLDGELTLSNSLTYIESGTFYNCFSIIGDLVIPSSVSGVGEYSFYNLGVDSLYLPESLKYISEGAFERLNDIRTDLVLPNGIVSIGDRAFADCDSLQEKLVIPSGIESIGEHSFSGCIGIENVFINSPTSIFQGSNAFEGIQGCLYVTPVYYDSYVSQLVNGKYQGMPVCLGSEESIVFDAVTYEIIQTKRGIIPSNWYSNKTQPSLLVIGNTCKGIDANAFVDSVGLVGGLGLSSGIKYIGENAFRNCSFSGDLIIDDSTTGIGSGAFENCSNFDGNLQLPYNLDLIYQNTFRNCSGIESPLVIPPRVGRIEDGAFENCSKLNGFLSLPAQCEYIGVRSFANCNLLSGSLIIPNSCTGVGEAAFLNCYSLNGEFSLPNSLESIGNSGFYNCQRLSGLLEIPPTIQYLGDYSFYNCGGFEGDLILPDDLETVRVSTFENCSGFEGDLIIPRSCSGIEARSFYNCSGFSGAIVITDIAAQNIGQDALFNTNFAQLVVHDNVSDISEGEFDYFKNFAVELTLQEGIASISDNAFKDYAFTGDFFLPGSVLIIGDAAFQNVQFDGEYLFSQGGVISIGSGAFKNCGGISGDLIFNDNLFYIGDEAFRNNTSINGTLRIPDFIETIGDYAFAGNVSMSGNIYMPNSLSGLGQGAFLNCSSLDGLLTISRNPFLTEIKTETFKNCSSISGDLFLPDNIVNVGTQAFKNCFNLDGTVTLTDTAALSLIGKDALDESNFDNLHVSNSVKEISDGEFDYFQNKVLTLTLPEDLTGVLSNSFDDYAIIGSLTFPEKLLYIGDNAFKNCDGLISGLIFPQSLTGIGDSAFEGCINLSGDLSLPIQLSGVGARSFYNCIGLDGELTISDFTASSVNLSDDSFFGTDFSLLRVESTDGEISNGEFDVLALDFIGSLDIGQSVFSVGEKAFDDFSFLGNFLSSGSLSSIGNSAFSGVSFVGGYEASLVTEIGSDAFRDCGFDGSIIFYDSTELIGDRAFYNCTGFSGDLKLTSSVYSIGDFAFYNCTGLNGEFILSDPGSPITDPTTFTSELKTIGSHAFDGCSGLSGNLIIQGNIDSIGSYAFYGCQSLDGYMYIGSGLSIIEESTFRNCSNISGYNGELLIPAAVTNIRANAFNGCSSLAGSLVISNIAARNTETNAFLGTNFDNIIVLTGSVSIIDGDFDYFQQTGVTLTLNDDLKSLESGAFNDFSFIGGLTIPATVTGIGKDAFRNNDGFNGSLTIPSETTLVDDFAFSGCIGFNGLSFNNYEFNKVATIGSGAFKDCIGFNNQLLLPGTLEVIKSGAFQGCSEFIGDLIIPEDVNEIGEHAFSGCTGISGVFIDTIPPSVFTEQNGEAFLGISGYLSLGVLIYTDYFNLSTPIGDDFWFQGMPISGVGASESVFYSGADDNILNREIQDSIDVIVEGNPYVIPDRWKSYQTPRPPVDDIRLSNTSLNCWFDLGALCEKIGEYAFFYRLNLRGSLDLGGDLRIIDQYAFYTCSNVTGLSLGSNLETVNERAFQSCSKIESDLIFKSNVSSIGFNSFYNCIKIPSISFLGGSLTGISGSAFYGCTSISEVIDFPEGLTTIGTSAFYGCSSLPGIILPDSLEFVGGSAFQNIEITSLTLPPNLTYLGPSAFDGCNLLDGNIDIPASLETLNSNVFDDCHVLKSVSFNDVKYILDYAFQNCYLLSGNPNNNGTLEIPASIVSKNGHLGQGVFTSCNSIKKVEFPDNFSGVNWVVSSAGTFQNCSQISGVSFGIGIDVIRRAAFQNNTSLTSVEWADQLSLTGMEYRAFYNTDLDFIYIPENVTELANDCFAYNTNASFLQFEPSGNLTGIGNTAFAFCSSITETSLPDLPKESGYFLGTSAFGSCIGLLGEIYIPDSVSGMGNTVFNSCSSASGFSWPSHLSGMPNGTFTNCLGFSGIVIPPQVTNIGSNVFQNCTSATGDINIHADIEYIGSYAFDSCKTIDSVTFNNTNELDILSYCFDDCTSLSGNNGVTILNNIKSVSSSCFRGTKIKYLGWNDTNSINNIYSSAFSEMYELTGISFPSGLSSIQSSAFNACSKLEYFDISNTEVPSLGNNAFQGCTSLSGFNIDNGLVQTIGSSSFQNCNSLEEVVIPNSVNSMGYYVFKNCGSIKQANVTSIQMNTVPLGMFDNAFVNGENSISFADNVNEMQQWAFRNSNMSGVVDLSNTNLNTLGGQVFYNTPLLSGVKFPSSMKYTPITGFALSNIYWIEAPGLEEIKNLTFQNCSNFTGFLGSPSGIPDTVKTIGTGCFQNCSQIKPRQNYLISGNVETIGDNNWRTQTSTQSLVIEETFSGSIGNFNWESADNMNRVDILFDNADASIGSSNWAGCDIITEVYINCPYSVWIGTNNFNNSSNMDIFIKNTHYNDYTVANNWSGEQGVPLGSTIISYVP